MNFLLDTNICSAYTKGNRNVSQRFLQYSGGLAISTITLAELYNGAYRVDDQRKTDQILNAIDDLLDGLQIVDYTASCSLEAGILKGNLQRRGIKIPTIDLLIASMALAHNMTFVTDNLQDFVHIQELRLENWIVR